MSRLSNFALAAPLALVAGMASAATVEPIVFDFGQLAEESRDKHGTELMWGASDYGASGHTVGGLTVRASDRAHLDGGFSSGKFTSAPSGLGYCDISDCNRSDSDGVREKADRLVISFSEMVEVLWTIRETTEAWRQRTGPDHTLADGCARVNGTDRDLSGGSFVEALGSSDEWVFEACESGSPFGQSDYYVTAATIMTPPAPVPVPAGVALLGTALAGLGLGAARRKG